MVQENYDAGLGIEDIVRDELRQLLPQRYAVHAGVVSDGRGYSAGDCDVVIFNDMWFPTVKAGAIPDSRFRVFPIEGCYGVVEIKQSLNARTLDEALRKLVCCHRLYREPTPRDRSVENRETGDCVHHISNPLYSAIFAAGLDKGADFLALVERFVRINQALHRMEVVRALCVLGHGVVTWSHNDGGELRPALFMNDDLYRDLFPTLQTHEDGKSTFYEFIQTIMAALYHAVLGPEDLTVRYGARNFKVKTSRSRGDVLRASADMLVFAASPCQPGEKHASPPWLPSAETA